MALARISELLDRSPAAAAETDWIEIETSGGTSYRLPLSAVKSLIQSTNIFPSCTTAERPSSPVQGQAVLDTTLGMPIWYNGTGWVKGDGTSA